MKPEIIIDIEARSIDASSLRNAITTRRRLSTLQKYFTAFHITQFLAVVLLFCSACGKKSSEQPDIKFDKVKWNLKSEGNYVHRKQMINDLLSNYQWAGLKKDSVIQMLGEPDDTAEGNLMYDYERRSFLGGLGTTIEAVVFELAPDNTVTIARLNDGGWD